MKIHDLKPAANSKKSASRLGRGIAGKGGKTAGRGTKGQKARNKVSAYFEGGQTPIHRSTPKLKGFNNPFRVAYESINLDKLEENFEANDKVTPEILREMGLLKKKGLIKVLGRGDLTKKLNITVHGASKTAKAAIEAAGGSIEILELPWGDKRPAARGSAHTNR
jgi:large subunit ribosomal protein L15